MFSSALITYSWKVQATSGSDYPWLQTCYGHVGLSKGNQQQGSGVWAFPEARKWAAEGRSLGPWEVSEMMTSGWNEGSDQQLRHDWWLKLVQWWLPIIWNSTEFSYGETSLNDDNASLEWVQKTQLVAAIDPTGNPIWLATLSALFHTHLARGAWSKLHSQGVPKNNISRADGRIMEDQLD